MGSFLVKSVIFIFMLLPFSASAAPDNLGMYGINLNMDLKQILDTAIEKGFRIKIYGSNLDSAYAARLFQLSYQYEVANGEQLTHQFGDDHIPYRIITNKEETKYAKGFSVYNFLNDKGNVIGSFIFEDNLSFINKNRFGNSIIPVKLYKENITIDMIFHNAENASYKPLFFAVSFFRQASVKFAIELLNKKFGPYRDLKGDHISARYWFKDGTSVSNYFGLNDRFVFYNIGAITAYNKKEAKLFEELRKMSNTADSPTDGSLKLLHEAM